MIVDCLTAEAVAFKQFKSSQHRKSLVEEEMTKDGGELRLKKDRHLKESREGKLKVLVIRRISKGLSNLYSQGHIYTGPRTISQVQRFEEPRHPSPTQ